MGLKEGLNAPAHPQTAASRRKALGLIASLFLLSLGGLLLHLRIHPVDESAWNWIPAISGIVTTFPVSVMFYYRKTVAWAYLITWAAVIVGTVAMALYSMYEWEGDITLFRIALHTTFPDIVILWAKVPLAYMVLMIVRPKGHRDAAA